MSKWTYVNCALVLNSDCKEDWGNLFKTWEWGDLFDKQLACNVPEGVEQSLQIGIHKTKDCTGIHFFGNLRGVGEEKHQEIINWFLNLIHSKGWNFGAECILKIENNIYEFQCETYDEELQEFFSKSAEFVLVYKGGPYE